MKQYVIIGGGPAAVGCIEGIRSVDRDGKIVLVNGEGRPVYCRPLISYYLQGKTDLERMKYRPDSFYAESGCEVICDRAARIDPEKRVVILESGKSLPYDALCVATGASPAAPAFEGLDTVKESFSFMTADDALALESAVTKDSRVLIVGAGLIGLKCAEGLSERAGSVTVCNRSPRILSRLLDEESAGRMQRRMEEHGVSFLLGDVPHRFDGNLAQMESGKVLSFDILVLAAGTRPNLSLLADIGAETDRGVLIDTAMRTSIDGIYAAGDCTQGYDASAGENRVLAIWPNASIQGSCAGVNMAGGSQTFDSAIPMNALGFFGLHALTAGRCEGEMFEEKTEDSLKRLYVKDGVLAGFVLLGNVDRAGIYTALIREKTPLDTLDFELLKKSPSLLPFSAEYRRQTLGGVV
ncbi:MAG: NAD(P)/FAD-dependent oxidoreductase [Oscillospiraceae bacterium]